MAIVTGNHFIYTVRPGDTLFALANQSGSSIEAIERANALYPPFTDRNLIYPGQVLVITQPRNNMSYSVAYVINQGDSLYSIGQKLSSHPDLLSGLNPQIINPNVIYADALLNVPVFIYEVEEGDSLFAISNKLGIPLHQMIAANQGRAGFSPDVIFIGYRLILPIPSSTNIVVFTPLPGTRIRPDQTIAGIARALKYARACSLSLS
jgi:LysM repeat protein